jgi:tRNA(Arg) A34 adenosine deaminase TadA
MTTSRRVLRLVVTLALMSGFLCLSHLPSSGVEGLRKSTAPVVDAQGCNDKLIDAILTVVEKDIVPLTQQGVKHGNKVFGAAVLKKDDLSLVMAGTNHESECPLWHGEVYTIKKLYEQAARPTPQECIFFATHQPCPMCLSAITWSGYDTIIYLFSYQDSKNTFKIPFDLQQFKDIFKLPGGDYNRKNAFWTSYDLISLIKKCDQKTRAGFMARVQKLKKQYDEMSAVYQKTKVNTDIPFK